MDESSSKNSVKKKDLDAIINTVNMAVGAGIAAAIAATNKTTGNDAGRLEKRIEELNAKFDRLSEQLKGLQPAMPQQKIEVGAAPKEAEKKENAQQKPQDVIYVRKSSEFSFYN